MVGVAPKPSHVCVQYINDMLNWRSRILSTKQLLPIFIVIADQTMKAHTLFLELFFTAHLVLFGVPFAVTVALTKQAQSKHQRTRRLAAVLS